MVGNPSAGTNLISWRWHIMSDVSTGRLMTDLVCGRVSHGGNAVCSCTRLLPSQAEVRCYTTSFSEYECLMYSYLLSLVSHDVASILERSVVFMWTRRRHRSRMAHLAFQVRRHTQAYVRPPLRSPRWEPVSIARTTEVPSSHILASASASPNG